MYFLPHNVVVIKILKLREVLHHFNNVFREKKISHF